MSDKYYAKNFLALMRWFIQLSILSSFLFFASAISWPINTVAQTANFHPCNAQPALPICRHGYGKKIAVRRWNAKPEALDKDANLKALLTTENPSLEIKNLKASAIMVQDLDSKEVLFARNADEVRAIASITKLMTALVILDSDLDMSANITITASDNNLASDIPSRLAKGTKWSRNDLLKMALTASENSAAHALARTYPGGMDAFALAMNNKAQEIGMVNSFFTEPTGLSNENVATAADLVKLVLAASKRQKISKYTTTAQQELAGFTFNNTNMLVGRPKWDIKLSKTGTTREAGNCLVMLINLQGHNLAIILLNANGANGARFGDAVRLRRIAHNELIEQ